MASEEEKLSSSERPGRLLHEERANLSYRPKHGTGLRRTIGIIRPDRTIQGVVVDSGFEHQGQRYLILATDRGLVAAQTEVRVAADCRARLTQALIRPLSGAEATAWNVQVLGLNYDWTPLKNQNTEQVTQSADRWLKQVETHVAAMIDQREELRRQLTGLNQERSTINPRGQDRLTIGMARRLAKVAVYGPEWAKAISTLTDASHRIRTLRSELRQLSQRQQWIRSRSSTWRYWLKERRPIQRQIRELRRELRSAIGSRHAIGRELTAMHRPTPRRVVRQQVAELARSFIHEDRRLAIQIGSLEGSINSLDRNISSATTLREQLRSGTRKQVTMERSMGLDGDVVALPKLVRDTPDHSAKPKSQVSNRFRVG